MNIANGTPREMQIDRTDSHMSRFISRLLPAHFHHCRTSLWHDDPQATYRRLLGAALAVGEEVVSSASSNSLLHCKRSMLALGERIRWPSDFVSTTVVSMANCIS